MLCFIIVLVAAACEPSAPNDAAPEGLQHYRDFWQEKDTYFRSDKSPMDSVQRAAFDSLARFPFRAQFRVAAKWIPAEKELPTKVSTTTPEIRPMHIVGYVAFEMEGKLHNLPVYRDLGLRNKIAKVKAPLLLPFTDLSNGVSSYAGGRYIDLKEEELAAESFFIDFNLAYNPYCVYNVRYSCPIPPEANHIAVAIEAGARY